MVPRIFHLSRGTGCGDLEIRGPNWLGPFVQGDQIFGDHLSRGTEFDGDLVQGDRFYGYRLSRGTGSGDGKSWDQMGLGPNASKQKYLCQEF